MKIMPSSMPIDFDKYFYNRKKDIKRLNSEILLLNDDIANQMLITGYRGVGKTSLIKKVLKDLPKEYLTTYIDLSNIYGREQGKLTEEEVIKEFLKQIENTLNERNLLKINIERIKRNLKKLRLKDYSIDKNHIKDIPLIKIKENYNKISDFAMKLPQDIIDSNDNLNGYIIAIDEFQLLNTVKNPDAFFWLIRSYTQVQYNVIFIFTGSVSRTSTIINTINGQDGAFGGRMLQINIDPFTKDETKEYIKNKSNGLQFTENGFERFYKCTRGIPAYINSLATILPNNEICDEEIIMKNLKLNIDHVAIMWLLVWGRLNNMEKNIIILIIENENVNYDFLLKNMNCSKITLNKYLNQLNNKGIIEYAFKKKYIIADKMLELWLKTKYENNGFYPS